MTTGCFEQLTLWDIGQQEVTVKFDGGRVVTDAGLVSIRSLDKELGILAGLAERFPDPRSQKFITYSSENLLAQRIYQILAGYPDGNDAQSLRNDPLFQTLLDISPSDEERTLASGSTLNRFDNAYTRRQADMPIEEREVLLEQQQARNGRVQLINDYLVDVFVRTRRERPKYLIIDMDATDDPTHGQQVMTFFHAFYGQYQYFPLLVFDGESGFPLAAWLRPGTVHASAGAVSTLDSIVQRVRQVWPEMTILVRGDSGFAMPEMYEYCEREGLFYIFGFSTNEVLKRQSDQWLSELELYYQFYGYRQSEKTQRFESIEDYQAQGWSRPRRILVKVEVNRRGSNRRFVVTNLSGNPEGLYKGVYVQRGDVPESPIGEMKKGLEMDRLSAHGFRANALRLADHALAYALVVLYREGAAQVPEVAKAEVSTLRQKLWKVGAIVTTSVRRIWIRFSETWPYQQLWQRAHQAVMRFAEQLRQVTAPSIGDAAMPEASPLMLK